MNINDLRKIAKRETTLSDIMVGKEKLKMDDVIRDYPHGVTVDGADMITIPGPSGTVSTFPVLSIKGEDKCFFGGAIVSNIVKAWLESVEGNTEALNAMLADGGITFKFTPGKTKNGNNITNVEIL